MKKEILENPNTDFNIHHSMLLKHRDGTVDMDFSSVGLTDEVLKDIIRIFIIVEDLDAMAAFAAKLVMEDLLGVPVRLVLSSEISDNGTPFNCNELLIIFPKSGDIDETYAALRNAKEEDLINLALVDAPEDYYLQYENRAILTNSLDNGIDIAMVNKYGEQLIACYELAVKMAYVRKKIDNEEYQRLLYELLSFMDKIQSLIGFKDRIQWWATKQTDIRDFFIVGSDIDYEVGLEGSQIIKKLSGFSSTAYDADELKEGTIGLDEDGTIVLFILTQEPSYEKMSHIMNQCKNHGAQLMALTMYGYFDVEDIVDFTIYLPRTDARFVASLALIPFVLLGYDIGVAKEANK